MPPQDQNNQPPQPHDETQLPPPVQLGGSQPAPQENHTELPTPLGTDTAAAAQPQNEPQPAPQQPPGSSQPPALQQTPESKPASPQQQPPAPPTPFSIPPNNAAQNTPFSGQESGPTSAQVAAAADLGAESEPDDPPAQLGPLARQYGQYEASLYTSGMDYGEIEQKLAEWRKQYANGASAMEILYGYSEDEDGSPSDTAAQPEAQQSASQSSSADKMPEDGELRVR